ncbi:MAG: O-antigen ligase family protein, partial [Candidatus Omnitrophica bacterium]|nr:O-antigen ligase family protein [Candidatus Omnitrophota bacterium]
MGERIYNGLIWLGLSAILVFTPLARGAVRVWSITPVLLVVTVLVFAWLWKLNNSPQPTVHSPRFYKTPLDIPILVFALLAVVSLVFSIYKYASFYALLRLLSYVGIYYLIVNNYSRGLRRYLIALVICLGTGLSIYGLLQYFGVLPHAWWIPNDFLAATYVNHNHFAGYLELVIPVTAGVLIGKITHATSEKPRTFGAVRLGGVVLALVIMVVAFVFTQSRGAWISLVISLFVMNVILIKRKILKPKSIAVLILAIALVLSFACFKEGKVSERID